MNIRSSADDFVSRTNAIVAEFKALDGPLLPMLHAVQEAFGYVPEEVKPVLAEALNLSRAEVHGVVSFYHDFRAHPVGRHVLKLCRAEACQSRGGEALADRVRELLGIDFHGTTPDGAVTLEPVYCLGLCACAPAAMLDDDLHGRLDADCLEALVGEARR